MLDRIRKILAPPVFEGDEEKTRIARMLNAILWVMCLIMLILTPPLIIFNPPRGQIMSAAIVATAILLGLGLVWLTRRGYVRVAGGVMTFFMLGVITVSIYGWGGIRNPVVAGYIVIIFMAALLLGGRGALFFGILSLLAAWGMFAVETNGAILQPFEAEPDAGSPFILSAIFGMAAVLVTFALRDLTTALRRARSDERALADSLAELETSRAELEVRTRDLERRSVQLQTAAEIARDATAARDLDELLNRAVSLIQSRFGYYYVGLFLIEEVGAGRARAREMYVLLRAATGEAGRQLLEEGHRLRVGGISVVGVVTATGQPRVVQNLDADAQRYERALLPETRSEMALPLRVGGRVIGALEVQSRDPAAFDSDDVAILQTMADQLAVAIQNTQLLSQMQRTVRELEAASGRYTRESWREALRSTERTLGYRYHKLGVEPILDQPSADGVMAGGYTVAVPIRFRDTVIGTFSLQSGGSPISEEALLLVQGVAERLTLALENARLLEETRQRATWEQTLSDVTARFTRSLDTDTLLQAAVRELGQILEMDEVTIHLGAPGTPVQVDEPQP